MKIGRNDPCSCGSGRKSKNCCGKAGKGTERKWLVAWILFLGLIVIGVAGAFHDFSKREKIPPPQRVWSEEHRHWHTQGTRPTGSPPPGKVWSEEHGHWHDAPAFNPSFQPPGPIPPGKIWSPEHGHWHNEAATSSDPATETSSEAGAPADSE